MNISVLVFTKNEEIHLPRCLGSISGSDDIVVVDSFSEDRTRDIAGQVGVRFVQHAFTGFGDQRSWALENIPLKNSWALILDADEVVPPELWDEMTRKIAEVSPETSAFRLRRRFFWQKKWVPRSSQYPSWVVRLVQVGKVRFINRGHSETQLVEGETGALSGDLIDENLKGIPAFRERQRSYAAAEARHELNAGMRFKTRNLFSADPLIRRANAKALFSVLPMRGFFFWLYLYLYRGGVLEGLRGLELCLEKARYQSQIAKYKRQFKAEENADHTH